MFQQISIYRVGLDKSELRVMARYTSGAVFDATIPAGNTDPLQIELPATDKGDPVAIITIDTRAGGAAHGTT